MGQSLYREMRSTHPERFTVGWRDEVKQDHQGRPLGSPCSHCVVEKRNPSDCDPCKKNPDRDRMKRAGLL